MEKSLALSRWRWEIRQTVKAAQPPNETSRGFKESSMAKPEFVDHEAKLRELAERLQGEGIIPISGRLKAVLKAKMPSTAEPD